MRPILIPAALLLTLPALAAEPTPSAAPPAAPQAAASLTVTLTGVDPQPSELRLGVYDEANYNGKPVTGQRVAAVSPQTVVTFDNLPPGRIAVKVLQDLDGDGEMSTTLIGIPDEPFGLSNNVVPEMSAPGFDKTSFDLKPGSNAITITMQRM